MPRSPCKPPSTNLIAKVAVRCVVDFERFERCLSCHLDCSGCGIIREWQRRPFLTPPDCDGRRRSKLQSSTGSQRVEPKLSAPLTPRYSVPFQAPR